MSLTNLQIIELANRMGTPLERVCFKNQLCDEKLVYNKGYIINMQDDKSPDGRLNQGSHYVALYVRKCINGEIQPIYFDSFGEAPPTNVIEFIKSPHNFLPYSKKDVQSICGEMCGWYCMAFLYFLSSKDFKHRTNCLYTDAENFTDLFNDLNISNDWKHNEFVLKQFFRSKDLSQNTQTDIGGKIADISSISNHPKGPI